MGTRRADTFHMPLGLGTNSRPAVVAEAEPRLAIWGERDETASSRFGAKPSEAHRAIRGRFVSAGRDPVRQRQQTNDNARAMAEESPGEETEPGSTPWGQGSVRTMYLLLHYRARPLPPGCTCCLVGLGRASPSRPHMAGLVGRDSGTCCLGSDGVAIVAQLEYACAECAETIRLLLDSRLTTSHRTARIARLVMKAWMCARTRVEYARPHKTLTPRAAAMFLQEFTPLVP